MVNGKYEKLTMVQVSLSDVNIGEVYIDELEKCLLEHVCMYHNFE